MKRLDLTGLECGGARVLHLVAVRGGEGAIWVVRCACGAEFERRAAMISLAKRREHDPSGRGVPRLRCASCDRAVKRTGATRRTYAFAGRRRSS
jgi:hypothetical protein